MAITKGGDGVITEAAPDNLKQALGTGVWEHQDFAVSGTDDNLKQIQLDPTAQATNTTVVITSQAGTSGVVLLPNEANPTLASATDVSGLNGRLQTIEGKYARSTRFASISSGTSGSITLPANSTVILDDFGGTVDAVVSAISGGRPSFLHAIDAMGNPVSATFDVSGNWTLSATPASYPVALLYRVQQTLANFSSTDSDICGIPTYDEGKNLESSQADTLYVATVANGGSDNNDGSSGSPFATIQHALNSLAPIRNHPAVINVGAGNFAGAYVQGFTFGTGDPNVGSYVQIQGTTQSATPATGTASGTTTSANTPAVGEHTQIIDSGQSWTVNDLRGKYLLITSGALVGLYTPIQSNTATTITVSRASAVASGVTYSIFDLATVINSGVVQAVGSSGGAVGTSQFAFVVQGLDQALSVGSVRIENFKMTTPRAVDLGSLYRPIIKGCTINASTTVNFVIGQGSSGCYVEECVFNLIAGAQLFSLLTINVTAAAYLQNNTILGSGTGQVCGGGTIWELVTTGNYYYNLANGFRARHQSLTSEQFDTISGVAVDSNQSGQSPSPDGDGQIAITSCKFTSCGTAIKVYGGVRGYILSTAAGSGNTTGLDVANGSVVFIGASHACTGTTELKLDGQAETLANFRTFSPKMWPNIYTGSQIRQDDSTTWTIPDSTATPGNVAQHTLVGKASIAIAATACVITNNRVKATSVVSAQSYTNQPLSVAVAAGTITVTLAAPAAGVESFMWQLVAV